jgi:hypothetical protein
MVPGKYPDPAMFLSSDSSDEDEDARNSAGIVLRAVLLLAAVLLCFLVDEVDVAGTNAVELDVEVDAALVMIPRIDHPDCCANCPL